MTFSLHRNDDRFWTSVFSMWTMPRYRYDILECGYCQDEKEVFAMEQGGNRPYHHGDLRRALLDAALQLVAERGIPDFTLREVARQAGVSHNAPYHHFADKAELVVTLTVEGFQTLE